MLHSLLLYGIQTTGEGDNSDKCCLISDTTYYDSHLKTSEYSSDFWKIMCSVLMFFCNVLHDHTCILSFSNFPAEKFFSLLMPGNFFTCQAKICYSSETEFIRVCTPIRLMSHFLQRLLK